MIEEVRQRSAVRAASPFTHITIIIIINCSQTRKHQTSSKKKRKRKKFVSPLHEDSIDLPPATFKLVFF